MSERENPSNSQPKVQALANFPGKDTLPTFLSSLTLHPLVSSCMPLFQISHSIFSFQPFPMSPPSICSAFLPPSLPPSPPSSLFCLIFFALTLVLLLWVSFNCHLAILLISITILYRTRRDLHALKSYVLGGQ